MSLNEKQKAFCEFYAACLNATEAAKKAGYSEKTAYSIGHRLLKNIETQKYIQQLATKAKTNRIATIDEVLQYLTTTMRNSEEQTRERTKAAQQLLEVLKHDKDSGEQVTEIEVAFVDASGEAEDETTS